MSRIRSPLLPPCVGLALCALLVFSTPPLAAAGAASGKPTGEESEAPDEAEGEAHEGEPGHGKQGDSSELSDEPIPLQLEGFPERPGLLVEIGNPYLGTGEIKAGVKMPGGAVWQPTLIVFGTFRTAVQSFEAGNTRITEWANRLDLFANLQLTGSERLVVGFRNLDQDGRFTSYILDPDPDDPAFQARFPDNDRFRDELNAQVQSLFFEGDFGELFPNLDREDFGRTDVGFSIGRQPLLFQEGMLIDDSIDGVGITRNTLLPTNTSNFRTTFFAGVENVNRAGVEDEEAELFAILTSTDLRTSTVDADLVYVTGDAVTGDLAAFGVSAVQRIGKVNTSFRLLGSYAVDQETPFATDGALLFSEVSWTPHHSHDLVYVTTFVALDEFSSAARGPATGGPLGRAGINFAAVGLGNYGAPLSSRARDVAGGALGYQKFYGSLKRRQLLAELGARIGMASTTPNAAAATLRFQQAMGRRCVLVLDGFAGHVEGLGVDEDDTRFGGRVELVLKF